MRTQYKSIPKFQMPVRLYNRVVKRMQKAGFHSVLEMNTYLNYLITEQLKRRKENDKQ